ncbi:hypothetical protein THAOC_01787, partial [Thalassiosira oceanica]
VQVPHREGRAGEEPAEDTRRGEQDGKHRERVQDVPHGDHRGGGVRRGGGREDVPWGGAGRRRRGEVRGGGGAAGPPMIVVGPQHGGIMEVEVREHGCRFALDFARVYFNSRLSGEHSRLVREIVRDAEAARQRSSEGGGGKKRPCVVADVMAGVGPFAVPLTSPAAGHFDPSSVDIVCHANDLNPVSHEYLCRNAKLNRCYSDKLLTYNLDGREFIRRMSDERVDVDHFIMNLPASAPEFLDAFRGYDFLHRDRTPRVHVHCFGEKARDAADAARVESDLAARCEAARGRREGCRPGGRGRRRRRRVRGEGGQGRRAEEEHVLLQLRPAPVRGGAGRVEAAGGRSGWSRGTGRGAGRTGPPPRSGAEGNGAWQIQAINFKVSYEVRAIKSGPLSRALSLLATSALRVLVDVHALGVGQALVRVIPPVAPADGRVLHGAHRVRIGLVDANALGVVLVLAVVVLDLAEETRAADGLVGVVAGLPEHGRVGILAGGVVLDVDAGGPGRAGVGVGLAVASAVCFGSGLCVGDSSGVKTQA